MNLSMEAAGWLAGSLVAALVADWTMARLLLELLRPASGFVFWIGRVAKVGTLILWLAFFNAFWHPRFLAAGEGPAPMIIAAEAAVVGVLLLLVVTTHPRAPRRLREGDA